MSKGTIKYDPDKHQSFQSELKKVQENFDDLISALKKVQTMSTGSLKGEAATSLETAIGDLEKKLTKEQSNWEIVIGNAKKIATYLKEADEKSAQSIKS